jgi:alpha-glucan, water dikinase
MTGMPEDYTFVAGDTRLLVSPRQDGDRLQLVLRLETGAECRLHWGLTRGGGGWLRPPEACWPPGTEPFDEHAVESPFAASSAKERTLEIGIDLAEGWHGLVFVLHFPEKNRWVKDGGRDFQIPLPRPGAQACAKEALAARTVEGDWQRNDIDLGHGEQLATATLNAGEEIRVLLACDVVPPLLLHWGISERFHHEWRMPPPHMHPPGSRVFDTKAVHTPFQERDGVQWIEMRFEKPEGNGHLRGMDFILYQPDENRWIKDRGKDMHLPLFEPAYADSAALESPSQKRLVNEILGAELGRNSWTLMHRFNLCHDLLDGMEQDKDALALLYTWLRFSAIRQLDWQRHYNTQPRELAHSQDRLTIRLTDIYRDHPKSRSLVRLMLGTLGRGGGRGQQVRDEILNIMHRHHIKEVGGHFMEEWHQKLHNNTTPDDVVICEGYLAFLRSDGDLDQFYGVLAAAGVSRKRLQSFDRAIVTDPDFIADKKHGLIEDFQNYLRVLNAVHSGTDLETAVAAARGNLDDHLNGKLDALFAHGAKAPPEWVRPKDLHKNRGARTEATPQRSAVGQRPSSQRERAKIITDVRKDLNERIGSTTDTGALRNLLYLDLALEEAMRGAIEGEDLGQTTDEDLFALTHLALEGLRLSASSQELGLCANHFATLVEQQNGDTDWALRAKSVTDRLTRAVGEWTGELYATLQPKAEFLGGSFGAEDWTVELFGEEVIRGGPAFTLTRLMRRLDPILRERAGIGGWQVLSPAQASGQVQVVDSLMSVQGETYGKATVLVTDKVTGEEEIPDGATAVLTSDTPDLVAHVAVRARNEQVLFATCFDEDTFQDLKSRDGQHLLLSVGAGGEIEYHEGEPDAPVDAAPSEAGAIGIRPRAFSQWAVGENAFDEEIVGGKSNNLNALRGQLSDWIGFPQSMALPFGAFEQALAAPENSATAEKIQTLLVKVPADPATRLVPVRKAVGELIAPDPLREALLGTWERVGLPPVPWEQAWRAVTNVWASKWNDRAYFSRVARGISHDDLMMAVLIQQVVEADYAFVIHTVNPINGDENEVYAELVLGMGETLVGNYPGRAMSFISRKDGAGLTLTAYPSKSLGLYGSGVIFRSDSNGEDLEGFAGAGLYDSFLAEKPRTRLLDYTGERLLNDPRFAAEMLAKIARIAIEVEQACGSPQDIEGAIQGGDFYVVQTRPQVGL